MKYLAILRGINVGGHKKILMVDLKTLFNTLGFTNVFTYIQGGNVLFETTEKKETLENTISKAITKTYGFDVPIIVITTEELQSLPSKNPYLLNDTIEQLHVTFLKKQPSKESVNKIKEMNFSPDLFEVIENLVFLNIEEGKYHKSKLNNNFFEKQLNTNATTRNWKTVSKLIELSKKISLKR